MTSRFHLKHIAIAVGIGIVLLGLTLLTHALLTPLSVMKRLRSTRRKVNRPHAPADRYSSLPPPRQMIFKIQIFIGQSLTTTCSVRSDGHHRAQKNLTALSEPSSQQMG